MGKPTDRQWSRALMATNGISLDHSEDASHYDSTELREARHPETARERVIELARSREKAVREAVAARGDCPLGVLITLAHDNHATVRISAAANTDAARAVLEHLAKDRDASVQKAVARNEATPPDILEVMAFSRKSDVRRVAAKRLNEVRENLERERARAPELLDRASAALPAEPLPETRQGDVLAPRPTVASKTEI